MGGHEFSILDPNEITWNDVCGIYIFAGMNGDGSTWTAEYIGHTNSFKNRFGNGMNEHDR